MKEIRELAQASSWMPKSGDQLRLYELAVDGATREGAKEMLDVSSNHFNVIYKKLKDNFTEGVLTHPTNNISKISNTRHEIRKQYAIAILLIRSEKQAAGIPLARATTRKAEKYNLFYIALDLCKVLRRYYGINNYDKKLYEYYTEKQKELSKEIGYELEAEEVFIELGHTLRKGNSPNIIKEKLNNLSKIQTKNYDFHFLRLLSESIFLQYFGKEHQLIELCTNALKFFEPYKDIPYSIRYSFYLPAVAILISKKEFQQAEVMINRCLQESAYGQLNWQIMMLHKAMMGFHSLKSRISFDTWNKLTKVPKKHFTEEMSERWLIIKAYLVLFDFEVPKKFRLRRFLNSVPISNADKAGQNINIIILELMHLLKAKKLRDFDDRCDQLDKYINQHLKGKRHQRSVSFLRMLQSIQRGGYHKVAAQRKAQAYLANLEKTSPNISANAVEIVPFKVLWNLVLDWL